MQAGMAGTRLAYVVAPIDGTVEREVCSFEKGKGIVRSMKKQQGGFMVYFPRGHAVRIRSEKELEQFNLKKKARIVNMQGLTDPNSPIGQMLMAQDETTRMDGWKRLEMAVIQLATAKSGVILMPEQVEARNGKRKAA
jgi:hypothetical protein